MTIIIVIVDPANVILLDRGLGIVYAFVMAMAVFVFIKRARTSNRSHTANTRHTVNEKKKQQIS